MRSWTLIRNLALLIAVAGAFVLAGCSSCKEYQEQILQLDSQIEDLQRQVADKETAIDEANQIAEGLRADVRACQNEKDVLIEKINEVVMIRIPEQLMFQPSSTIVLDTMVPTLEAIARQVREHPDWEVFVAGHTDNKKIAEEWIEKYPSNIELGAYRSAAVVRYMINDLDLPADRFATVSYGPFRPVTSNDTDEGRSQNRRVEIVLHKPQR
jgi:chemotaxis protein MotB